MIHPGLAFSNGISIEAEINKWNNYWIVQNDNIYG